MADGITASIFITVVSKKIFYIEQFRKGYILQCYQFVSKEENARIINDFFKWNRIFFISIVVVYNFKRNVNGKMLRFIFYMNFKLQYLPNQWFF